MLAKLTAKNQLTLPKAAIEAVGVTEYFEVVARDGVITLTPVRIQRGDAVRAKLTQLSLTESDISAAVNWARRRVAESKAIYPVKKPARKAARKTAKRKS